MTPRQTIALRRLSEAGGGASAYWLANGTGLTTSQMTRALRQLEKCGLAVPASSRFRHVIRNHHWFPSAAGLELAERAQ